MVYLVKKRSNGKFYALKMIDKNFIVNVTIIMIIIRKINTLSFKMREIL